MKKRPQFTFRFLKPVSKTDIPKRTGVGRRSIIDEQSFFKELRNAFTVIRDEGVAPFEEAVELNIDDFSKDLKSLKNPVMSVLNKIKSLLKEYKIEKDLDITVRGHKLFLSGRSAE